MRALDQLWFYSNFCDYKNILKVNKLTFQISGKSCTVPDPPKIDQAPNRPKKGAKLTGMDLGEFTYTLWPTS